MVSNNSQKVFIIRIIITLFALLIFGLHLFLPSLRLDTISFGLLIIAIIPWLSSLFESLELPGGWKLKFNKEISSANKFVNVISESGNYFEVKNKSKESIQLTKREDLKNILSMKARINYDHEAGGQYLLKIYINGEPITARHLINKPITKENASGRISTWFDDKIDCWKVVYSPNFFSNYLHHFYKVVNGDPYEFIFDISEIKENSDGKFKIIFEHNGKTGNDAYKNSIIVKDVGLI